MRSLWLSFSNPWLLLLIIPAIALVLLPHFRLSKKYRRNRNRITTIVLQLIVMVLAVTVLSGMTFHSEHNNTGNQVLLLVDMSDTEEQSAENRDSFVKAVLDAGKNDKFNIGIVTFGFDQRYVAEFSTDADKVFEEYMRADKPDTSATDIAAALSYAKDLFTGNGTSKIVLITDGKETDEDALTVIKSVTAKNIVVDTVNIPSSFDGSDARITGITLPDYHVKAGDECSIDVLLSSTAQSTVSVTLYDNGSEIETKEVNLSVGARSVNFTYAFGGETELRKIEAKISGSDAVEQNNSYTTYFLLEKFDKVLIIEHAEGESVELADLLTSQGYKPTIANVHATGEAKNMPQTIDELRQYDQVVLNNIANEDLSSSEMPENFDEMLYSYVYEYGGGLFTAGGTEDGTVGEGSTAHAYNRLDLSGTLLQSMLPVQAIDYTPPIAVVVLIDRSGSMASISAAGQNAYWHAINGAGECLNALTERDYFGIITFDDSYQRVLDLTPVTQKSVIYDTLQNKMPELGGGTVFTGAVKDAVQMLIANKKVSRRHIIMVTDAQINATEASDCEAILESYYKSDKITFSALGIGSEASDAASVKSLQRLIDAAGGQQSGIPGGRKVRTYDSSNLTKLYGEMREELNVKQLKEVNEEPFYITVDKATSPVLAGLPYREEETKDENGNVVKRKTYQLDTPQLGGFYGVRVKSNDYLILKGDYEVPLYAQWKFGKGTVGSFMTDLQASEWSSDFMSSETGRELIGNIIGNLMPTENIRPNEMRVELSEDNYINRVSVFATLKDGERVEGKITDVSSGTGNTEEISMNAVTEGGNRSLYVTSPLAEANNFGRCTFVVKKAGIYSITLVKKDKDGNELATYTVYKAFSYSKEYDLALQAADIDYEEKFFKTVAENGGGAYLSDMNEAHYAVFDNFDKTIEKVFDPRYLFMIIAVILFVTEIAVRKFKFKWLHEIIREARDKKQS